VFGKKEKERKMMMMKLYNCDTGNKRKKGKKRRSVHEKEGKKGE
jgi:hypothetical protein